MYKGQNSNMLLPAGPSCHLFFGNSWLLRIHSPSSELYALFFHQSLELEIFSEYRETFTCVRDQQSNFWIMDSRFTPPHTSPFLLVTPQLLPQWAVVETLIRFKNGQDSLWTCFPWKDKNLTHTAQEELGALEKSWNLFSVPCHEMPDTKQLL